MTSPPFMVKAIYEYSSPHDDDLKFPVGQIITVTDEEGDDWYYGEYSPDGGQKQEGLFPRNFVKHYEPETPPRPSRLSRSKKEIEGSRTSSQPAPTATQPSIQESKGFGAAPQETIAPAEEPVKVANPSSVAPHIVSATKPGPSSSSKPVPTPSAPAQPSESTAKPELGSFRDRLNAFNKPAAPPVAPKKPGALGSSSGSSFVKKAFVAPPPSKNAYVPIPREAPPQKVYHREEELEAEAQDQASGETEPRALSNVPASTALADEDGDQPKPTSLKERIALLQKQQAEQAARHADPAQRKEKAKRPPPKRMESQERPTDGEAVAEGIPVERVDSGETAGKRSMDVPRILAEPRSYNTASGSESLEATPYGYSSGPVRDHLNDPNDADMSGAADTEDGEDLLTRRGGPSADLQGLTRAPTQKVAGAPSTESYAENNEVEADEDGSEEEDDVDPEVKKRLEIRERMAKMSGGMGMAGMFGAPGGMAPLPLKRQVPSSSERKSPGQERKSTTESVFRAPPVPMMPMPGLTKIRTPEHDDALEAEVTKEDEEDVPTSIAQGRQPADMPDVEDLKPEPVAPSRRSTDQARVNPPPHDSAERPVPPVPGQARQPPPPPPTERVVPPTRVECNEGSESDDELSERARKASLRLPTSDDSRPVSREGPPSLPLGAPPNGPPPSLPSRPRGPSVQVPSESPVASDGASPTSPTTPSATTKRSSRPPPIPGSSPAIPPSASQNRAPPPPPPTSAPPSRVATGDMRAPPPIPKTPAPQESDEEVTEYEGDYDTDIASGDTHKAALKSHSKDPIRESHLGISFGDNDLRHSGTPSMGPTPTGPSRAVPPLPPSQPPRGPRQSSETPRGGPPPPPVPISKEPQYGDYEEEHHNYSRSIPQQRAPPVPDRGLREELQPQDQDDMYSATPPQPQRSFPQSPPMPTSQYASPSLSAPNRSAARQSSEIPRNSISGRRSMDAPRVSSDQGFMATDIDLGHASQWWTEPEMAPPALQNRRDIIYETEDSTTTKRGGRQAITRNVYVLYMDYSQTIIAAHFEARDPSDASLEQHHEPAPPRLRQDQLENAHTMFGTRIAEDASSKKDTTVGDGTPNTLVLNLLSSLPTALRPVGTRAYGALVYANLANASVQQFDEIRSGDIVTFRNAKFQGHRGPMKTKYTVDIGKPDHVGVVVDWDGTKKKVRAWEQGRESKKVKMESFKLGDMRSGEVKVWRVMARGWVGWE
ncbi:MAG: hypothetical protein Q9212_002792 [Teloschistes hypoglaucus]